MLLIQQDNVSLMSEQGSSICMVGTAGVCSGKVLFMLDGDDDDVAIAARWFQADLQMNNLA